MIYYYSRNIKTNTLPASLVRNTAGCPIEEFSVHVLERHPSRGEFSVHVLVRQPSREEFSVHILERHPSREEFSVHVLVRHPSREEFSVNFSRINLHIKELFKHAGGYINIKQPQTI